MKSSRYNGHVFSFESQITQEIQNHSLFHIYLCCIGVVEFVLNVTVDSICLNPMEMKWRMLLDFFALSEVYGAPAM